MDSLIIEVHIDKAYYSDDTPIIRNFDLTATRGEIVAVTGPSGIGKSTLLKIISGLHTGFTGSVRLKDGARLAFIPQKNSLLPWMTVYENVTSLAGLGGSEIDISGAHRLIEELGLGGFEKQYPGRLSGGQYQRCALGQAFFLRPDILLMDEPFSSLDAETKREVQNIFLRLSKNTDMTTIFVTHSTEEAAYMNGRVMELTPA